MKTNSQPQSFKDILSDKANKKTVKPPAYSWQDLALRIINELNIPNFKRNSVFKICKDQNKNFVEKALNDTKELCKTVECWKYFFKLVSKDGDQKSEIRNQKKK